MDGVPTVEVKCAQGLGASPMLSLEATQLNIRRV